MAAIVGWFLFPVGRQEIVMSKTAH